MAAAGLDAVRASRRFVVGDALVHAVVAGAADQLGHARGAVAGEALLVHAVLSAWHHHPTEAWTPGLGTYACDSSSFLTRCVQYPIR